MANNMININIDIPADKKEIITAFKGLINAFKNDIKVREVESSINIQEFKEKDLSYEEAKNDFFNKYVGSLKINDNAEQQYNQHRVTKYGK